MIGSRHDHRSGRRAHRSRMEFCEPDPLGCKLVQRRSLNLSAKAARVTEPQIIADDDKDVGALGWLRVTHVERGVWLSKSKSGLEVHLLRRDSAGFPESESLPDRNRRSTPNRMDIRIVLDTNIEGQYIIHALQGQVQPAIPTCSRYTNKSPSLPTEQDMLKGLVNHFAAPTQASRDLRLMWSSPFGRKPSNGDSIAWLVDGRPVPDMPVTGSHPPLRGPLRWSTSKADRDEAR